MKWINYIIRWIIITAVCCAFASLVFLMCCLMMIFNYREAIREIKDIPYFTFVCGWEWAREVLDDA